MLAEGQTAPDFTTEDLDGKPVRLGGLRGQPVWLAFFRFASCPLCNYRVHEMIERWPTFEGRAFHLLAVFQSPVFSLREFVATRKPPFTLIADPTMALYSTYGLETSVLGAMTPNVMRTAGRAMSAGVRMTGRPDGPPMRIPGDYLIDPQGVIRKVYRGKDIADHIPFDLVDRELRALGA